MGKGDQKSKRGKISRGTSGVRRQKKKISTVAVVKKPKAAPKKAAPKKAAPKKTAAKKVVAKKEPAKKPAAKKTITKKKAED